MQCVHYLERRYPCGHCMACRLNRQRDKKIRIMFEQKTNEKCCYLTLTYAPEFLPGADKWDTGTLVKKDLQDFLKRFRKNFPPRQIRYYACGEYGKKGERAHYHLIIFGCDMRDKRVFKNLRYDPKKKTYRCTCESWGKGFTTVDEVNEARCAYVAKYCLKKVCGKEKESHYQGREPEFCLTSRGLGLEYINEHKERLKRENCVSIRGNKFPLPRYIVDKIFTEKEKFARSLDMRKETEARILEETKKNNNEAIKNADLNDPLSFGRAYSQYMKDQNDARVKNLCQHLAMKGREDSV